MKFRPKTVEERRRDLVIGSLLLLACLIFAFWYVEAAGVLEHVPGTYVYKNGRNKVILVLSDDHLFQETMDDDGTVSHAEGSWHTFGEGHISFSKEFLPLRGQEICYGNQSCGWLEDWFGFVTMDLGLNEPGLKFRKRLF